MNPVILLALMFASIILSGLLLVWLYDSAIRLLSQPRQQPTPQRKHAALPTTTRVTRVTPVVNVTPARNVSVIPAHRVVTISNVHASKHQAPYNNHDRQTELNCVQKAA